MLKINSSEVFKMEGLVEYQPGAIISRELIQKSTGTITVFAFDEGQGLSEHIAPFDALVYILDGEAEIKIAENTFQVKKGEMIILPVDVIHALKAIQRFKMVLIMIR